ncbi:MAG TPA: hypothetical protein VF228_17355 [Iamia sp.]
MSETEAMTAEARAAELERALRAAIRGRQHYQDRHTPRTDPAIRAAVHGELKTLERVLRLIERGAEDGEVETFLMAMCPSHMWESVGIDLRRSDT